MKNYLAILFLVFGMYMSANVTLPLLFNDGMVLQRNKPISVWGWADANEKIEIQFNKQILKIKADKNGKWFVALKPEKAGGPFKMAVKGKNSITINDVLVGEVWICSGQSNMEFTVANAMNAAQEINDANYPMIRQFLVEKEMSSTPKTKLKSGSWAVCNQNTVGNFTAVGYYFAKKIYNELKIPIGLIHSSWGGTCVETWTSREAFDNSDEFKNRIGNVDNLDLDLLAKNKLESLSKKIEDVQGAKIIKNSDENFRKLDYDDGSWATMQAPDLWENQKLNDVDGVVWMRKTIVISKEDANKKAVLELAKIDDEDITYVNGIEVGTQNQYNKKRVYEIPKGILKEGRNVIAVKITDYTGGGGIFGDQADLKLSIQQGAVIPLFGQWKYRVIELKLSISPNEQPSLLYNAMINPLIPYTFQGVLWYQGEANVHRAEQYKKVFPLLINDWRTKWEQGKFPFYFVQLSSFDEFGGNSKSGSRWAELREAQSQTLELPNTGMVVTTDIGNPTDIHPTNKQDVGKRLAAIALNKLYKKDVVFSGPTFQSMEVKGNQVVLTFDNIGKGLMASDKNNYLKGFEVAGKDKIFHYAKGYIDENKVMVSNDKVPNPVAIHYGWADDASDCNLYNVEGFPASPFRTDTWEMITKDIKYSVE